jgi:hypothetical protein
LGGVVETEALKGTKCADRGKSVRRSNQIDAGLTAVNTLAEKEAESTKMEEDLVNEEETNSIRL